MGVSYKDIENTGKLIVNSIESRLEQNSQEKAEKLVKKISQTRGLWVLPHFVAFCMVFAVVGALISVPLGFIVSDWIASIVGGIIGLFIALKWWNADYTKEHPLVSCVVAGYVAPCVILYVIGSVDELIKKF